MSTLGGGVSDCTIGCSVHQGNIMSTLDLTVISVGDIIYS